MMIRKKMLKNDTGFTLLEVLVAAVILSIGLMGTAGFLTKVIRSDKLSNEMGTATVLAQAKMEELFQAGYLDTVDDVGTTTTENYNSITFAGTSYPDFERETSILNIGTNGALGITVRINYKAFGEHSFTARTILSREIK